MLQRIRAVALPSRLSALGTLILLAALCAAASAQTVRLTNYSGGPWEGIVRTTVDRLPPHAAGTVGQTWYVVGRQVGADTHTIDVGCRLGNGESRTLELASADPMDWTPPALPADPLAQFGGPVTLDGQPMQLAGLEQNGAGWDVHLHLRRGPMLHVDLWVTWYPSQPAWASGEALVVASNPTVPDMGAEVDAAGLTLAFGDSWVLVPGRGIGSLVAPGTHFGDGQGRALPLVFVWPRHLTRASDWSSVGATASFGVAAVGIERLTAAGNPIYPAGFAARSWATQGLATSIARLHSWQGGWCGPNMVSGDTGRQEEQTFTRGEPLRYTGAVWPVYLSACKMANRPCHHLEVDGGLVRAWEHPLRLVMWDGRAHWHTGVSPDQLGKPRGLSIAEANGWWGPDVEHWLMMTLCSGLRYTGSPLLQTLLEEQARIYPLQWTTTPGWSTTQPYASRAIGWEGINAVLMAQNLPPASGEKVRLHWLDRWAHVIAPELRAYNPWDQRLNDPRLGPGAWWMPWQQAVGAYGLDLAGEVFGVPEAREIGLAGARKVVDEAWRFVNGQWLCRAQQPVDPALSLDGDFDGSFSYFGMALAPAVVLRHDPNDARARAIWTQLTTGATLTEQTSWLAPGVQ